MTDLPSTREAFIQNLNERAAALRADARTDGFVVGFDYCLFIAASANTMLAGIECAYIYPDRFSADCVASRTRNGNGDVARVFSIIEARVLEISQIKNAVKLLTAK